MNRVLILGCGQMGTTIARDLALDYSVTVIDSSQEALEQLRRDHPKVQIEQVELTGEFSGLTDLLQKHHLVIGALPGLIGYSVLQSVIQYGRPVVDISFFPEDPGPLSYLAEKNDVVVAVDCGLAPGLCNLILGRHLSEMEVLEYRCLVGGLPVRRTLPFQYKAPFSSRDVIEEYIRPVRLRRNGEVMTLPPLSEPEPVDFPEVGTLEAFNTDGLRTLLDTTSVPTMVEKTLRYPGHRDQIQFLRQAGFLNTRKETFRNHQVSPLEMTARILETAWAFEPGEADLTLMRVQISGEAGGQTRGYCYDLIDRFDPESQTRSMSRTTGFTCAAVARLILEEKLTEPGLWAPELIGRNVLFADFIVEYLAGRGVELQVSHSQQELT